MRIGATVGQVCPENFSWSASAALGLSAYPYQRLEGRRAPRKVHVHPGPPARRRGAASLGGSPHGRPQAHDAADVARVTAREVEYIRTRAQDDDYYCKLIKDYLTEFQSASRKEIDKLLMDKFSDVLSERQKKRKIANLLTKMRRAGVICNNGSRKEPSWEFM
ncbi:MAG: hypothetical protein ACOX51_01220 [Myxococcota bacterium]|jgi:hypothetical protein|nr:hypothetical protein [Myxococcota bacterium]MBP8971334.1 hypothetical protein [Myxococcota bacterium]HHW97412.1 hypothetical protein [Oligoflexales bacterium]HQC45529.1 hypothetical protein [Myxococcota bacterium]